MAGHKHARRLTYEWEADRGSMTAVLVIESSLVTDPCDALFDEEKIKDLVDWALTKSQEPISATRVRIIPLPRP